MPRLSVSATQGGADAFVAQSLDTGLSGQTQRGYQVQQIVYELPQIVATDGADQEIAVSRRTKTSMPKITDIDVINKHSVGSSIVTSGSSVLPRILRWEPVFPVYIVEDTIYLLYDSTSTGTNTVYCEIWYDIVSLSEIDRLSLLVRSLQED